MEKYLALTMKANGGHLAVVYNRETGKQESIGLYKTQETASRMANQYVKDKAISKAWNKK